MPGARLCQSRPGTRASMPSGGPSTPLRCSGASGVGHRAAGLDAARRRHDVAGGAAPWHDDPQGHLRPQPARSADRVSMTVDRASFDDLVTLVTGTPPWEKNRLADVRTSLRAIGERQGRPASKSRGSQLWSSAQGDRVVKIWSNRGGERGRPVAKCTRTPRRRLPLAAKDGDQWRSVSPKSHPGGRRFG
jgi:hypothetical protein